MLDNENDPGRSFNGASELKEWEVARGAFEESSARLVERVNGRLEKKLTRNKGCTVQRSAVRLRCDTMRLRPGVEPPRGPVFQAAPGGEGAIGRAMPQ